MKFLDATAFSELQVLTARNHKICSYRELSLGKFEKTLNISRIFALYESEFAILASFVFE